MQVGYAIEKSRCAFQDFSLEGARVRLCAIGKAGSIRAAWFLPVYINCLAGAAYRDASVVTRVCAASRQCVCWDDT